MTFGGCFAWHTPMSSNGHAWRAALNRQILLLLVRAQLRKVVRREGGLSFATYCGITKYPQVRIQSSHSTTAISPSPVRLLSRHRNSGQVRFRKVLTWMQGILELLQFWGLGGSREECAAGAKRTPARKLHQLESLLPPFANSLTPPLPPVLSLQDTMAAQ